MFTGEFIAWSMTFAMFFMIVLLAIYYFGGRSAHGYIAFILVLVLIPTYSIMKESSPLITPTVVPPTDEEAPAEDDGKTATADPK